jgi:hypothetical protein
MDKVSKPIKRVKKSAAELMRISPKTEDKRRKKYSPLEASKR